MILKNKWGVVIISFLLICTSCNTNSSSKDKVKLEKLTDFETIISVEEKLVGLPTIIKYGGGSTLYIYDKSKRTILKVKNGDKVVQTYGRPGRGPGEILKVNNIFLRDPYLYIVDKKQYFIHKYHKNGKFVSSLNYGKLMGLGQLVRPPAPFSPTTIKPTNINNQPFVDQQGRVLLSSINYSQNNSSLYKLYSWKGNFISSIGAIPPGSRFTITSYDKIRAAAANHKVPALFRPQAFPIGDLAANNYFLVYSSIPKIVKYNKDGVKLWEKKIEGLQAIKQITSHFAKTMEKMNGRNYIALDYYAAGTGRPEGGLFLITAITPISGVDEFYIHQFNSKGKLINRYRLISDETALLPIFDIDFENHRIFAVTEMGEVRAYSF